LDQTPRQWILLPGAAELEQQFIGFERLHGGDLF
jgi:hypothetical protein